ncbi:MAG: dephospho-CoA kinase [Syntrophotaleaceae bacterium]
MVLGLTGGIASGKSTIADIFRQFGAAVVSADVLAREVVRPGSAVLAAIAEHFGRGILYETGSLNRKAMAELIFRDPGARSALNTITHPAIAELADRKFDELKRSGAQLIVYDVPLLFEAGAERQVDKVLVVNLDREQQLLRLQKRDGISLDQAEKRIASQMPLREKVARADFVIDNSGSLEETVRQVRELLDRLGAGPGIPSKPGCSG